MTVSKPHSKPLWLEPTGVLFGLAWSTALLMINYVRKRQGINSRPLNPNEEALLEVEQGIDAQGADTTRFNIDRARAGAAKWRNSQAMLVVARSCHYKPLTLTPGAPYYCIPAHRRMLMVEAGFRLDEDTEGYDDRIPPLLRDFARDLAGLWGVTPREALYEIFSRSVYNGGSLFPLSAPITDTEKKLLDERLAIAIYAVGLRGMSMCPPLVEWVDAHLKDGSLQPALANIRAHLLLPEDNAGHKVQGKAVAALDIVTELWEVARFEGDGTLTREIEYRALVKLHGGLVETGWATPPLPALDDYECALYEGRKPTPRTPATHLNSSANALTNRALVASPNTLVPYTVKYKGKVGQLSLGRAEIAEPLKLFDQLVLMNLIDSFVQWRRSYQKGQLVRTRAELIGDLGGSPGPAWEERVDESFRKITKCKVAYDATFMRAAMGKDMPKTIVSDGSEPFVTGYRRRMWQDHPGNIVVAYAILDVNAILSDYSVVLEQRDKWPVYTPALCVKGMKTPQELDLWAALVVLAARYKPAPIYLYAGKAKNTLFGMLGWQDVNTMARTLSSTERRQDANQVKSVKKMAEKLMQLRDDEGNALVAGDLSGLNVKDRREKRFALEITHAMRTLSKKMMSRGGGGTSTSSPAALTKGKEARS